MDEETGLKEVREWQNSKLKSVWLQKPLLFSVNYITAEYFIYV